MDFTDYGVIIIDLFLTTSINNLGFPNNKAHEKVLEIL